MAGRTDRAIAADLFRYHGIPDTTETWQRFLNAYVRHLPRQLTRLDGRLMPGVSDLLRRLDARRDVLLGLLTGNFSVGARLKLEHYGVYEYFGFGGFGDRHHHRNDVAREAVAALHAFLKSPQAIHRDIQTDRMWVIGDTPADIECGRAIGANVVAVCTGFYAMEALQAAEPDHLFVDFSKPERLLELLG